MNKQFYEELLKTLLEKRQIPLQGEINRECFEMVNHSLMYLNAKDTNTEIKLLINSNGGNTGYGLVVYDAVVSSSAPVTGIVIGPAHSMAAVVLQGCTKRVATPNSNICIHNINTPVEVPLYLDETTSSAGELDVDKVRESLSRDTKSMQSICRIISERSNLSIFDIIKMSNSGEIISAKDAKSYGLIDKVINKAM